MKNLRYIVLLILIAFIIPVFCTACGLKISFTGRTANTPGISEATTDISSLDPPLLQTPATPLVLMPVASGTRVESNEKALIDYSNIADGYVMIKWLSNTDNQLRVLITGPGDITYTYRISPDTTFVVFPLSDGDGSYEVKALEQTANDRYATAVSVRFSVTLTDEFAPF